MNAGFQYILLTAVERIGDFASQCFLHDKLPPKYGV
jgi:hypothetical protein